MAEIIVKVKGGVLKATESQDVQYPGIDIEFIPNKRKNTISNPRVLMEKPLGEELRVLIWTDKNNEDYTREIEFN